MKPIKVLLTAPIHLYRLVLSPLFPRACRFNPTCSEYAIEAIREHPAPTALCLIIRRILRCHPFHPGGLDPLPRSEKGT